MKTLLELIGTSLLFSGLFAVPSFAQAVQTTDHETFVWADHDNPELAAAMKKGAETLPHFWKIFESEKSQDGGFGLKVGMPTNLPGKYEFIWMSDIQRDGDMIVGNYSNDPVNIPGAKYGDRAEFTDERVIDWQYFKDGLMYGHYTTRILIKEMPAEEVAYITLILGENP